MHRNLKNRTFRKLHTIYNFNFKKAFFSIILKVWLITIYTQNKINVCERFSSKVDQKTSAEMVIFPRNASETFSTSKNTNFGLVWAQEMTVKNLN